MLGLALNAGAVVTVSDVAPAGQVRFYQVAGPSFDAYTANPTASQQNWMNEHYWRIHTFAPYFNSRLSWFPDAWVYVNAYGIDLNDPILAVHPDWVLRDSFGNALFIPFACNGVTCPRYAGDFGNPEFRAWWIAKTQAFLDVGYLGFFMDDVNLIWRVGNGSGDHVTPQDPRMGAPMTLDDWRRYFVEFLEQVRAEMPTAEIAHNSIWFATDVNDPWLARQVDALDYYNMERGVNDNGLVGGGGRWGFETYLEFVDFIHSRDRSVIFMDEGDFSQLEYGLAGWFLINDGSDVMSSEDGNSVWTTPDNWWPGFDADLGEALGMRYFWNDVIRRDFECGIVLLNQPGMPTRNLALTGGYMRVDGSQVSNLQLPARSAAVLLSPPEQCSVGNQSPNPITAILPVLQILLEE